MLTEFVVSGKIVPPNVVVPPTSKLFPILALLAIPIPPVVTIAPVPVFTASAIPLITKLFEIIALPVTSNASAGERLLIPTFCVESILSTGCKSPALLTRKSMFAPDVLLEIIAFCHSIPN